MINQKKPVVFISQFGLNPSCYGKSAQKKEKTFELLKKSTLLTHYKNTIISHKEQNKNMYLLN